jgi:hypothetical protein
MPLSVDRLVVQWGALQVVYLADARYVKDGYAPNAVHAIAAAEAALEQSVVDIARAVRDRIHIHERGRQAHADHLRRARHSLAEAGRVVGLAHRAVEHARETGALGRNESETSALRREPMQNRHDGTQQVPLSY